jgi:xanthine dehydrogenase accessory factor
MKKFYEKLAALLDHKESFAIATLFDKTGSAPRSDGAKMIIRADGSIFGTVGGGRLEAAVIRSALEVMASHKPVIQVFDLTGKDAAGSDMICGGRGELLIDFVDPADTNQCLVFSTALNVITKREKGWLVTVLDNQPASNGDINRQQCLVRQDKTLVGCVECHPDLLEHLVNGPAKVTLHSEVYDDKRFLVEPLRVGGTVIIFGAGHVSQKIAPLSESVGFRTVVLDDRPEFANRERFAAPVDVRVIDDFTRLPDLGIDEDSYLVIVTRGHLFDKDVLAQVLHSGAAYIGMIGSRNKRDLVYQELMTRGFAEEELRRVYCPIGTAILAETPEELGISIVGELVRVRAERSKAA